jgi:predicted ABC-type ATPase
MDWKWLNQRPLILALAGSNGAGKTTFFNAHLANTGLRFINADVLAENLKIGPYEAAEIATKTRETLVARGESFIFETVFSNPVADKVQFLKRASQSGYYVGLIFIRIPSVATSQERVSMHSAQGGHDVPDQKLKDRFSRTLANLKRAIDALPLVIIYDNSDLSSPFQLESVWMNGLLDN